MLDIDPASIHEIGALSCIKRREEDPPHPEVRAAAARTPQGRGNRQKRPNEESEERTVGNICTKNRDSEKATPRGDLKGRSPEGPGTRATFVGHEIWNINLSGSTTPVAAFNSFALASKGERNKKISKRL